MLWAAPATWAAALPPWCVCAVAAALQGQQGCSQMQPHTFLAAVWELICSDWSWFRCDLLQRQWQGEAVEMEDELMSQIVTAETQPGIHWPGLVLSTPCPTPAFTTEWLCEHGWSIFPPLACLCSLTLHLEHQPSQRAALRLSLCSA